MKQDNLGNRIEELAIEYGKVVTHTGTELEQNSVNFFQKWFKHLEKIAKLPIETKISPVKK